MSDERPTNAESDELLAAAVDDRLDDLQRDDLERRLLGSAQAIDDYVDQVILHAMLQWEHAQPLDPDDEQVTIGPGSSCAAFIGRGEQDSYRDPLKAPLIAVQYPESAIHSPLGGVFFSYLVAAVVVGLGMLIGSAVSVSPATHLAGQSPPPGKSAVGPRHESVGRITGMVDCNWSDPATAAVHGAYVRVNRKYAIRSGLMEITYDSGAKVILQGPVTYQVDSASGGFLSVGKLTARVEKKVESGEWRVESARQQAANLEPQIPNQRVSNPQSPIPNPSSLPTLHSSLFTVRTPTATVTDLGTEFGVEVGNDGLTQVHVLQGAVDARIIGAHQDTDRHNRVTEGCAVRIGGKDRGFETVAFAPRSFVRKLLDTPAEIPAESAYVHAVLADRPSGYWLLNEPVGARKFLDRSGNGVHGYAMGKVAAGAPGPWAGGSRAVLLDGNGYVDFGRCDQFARKNDLTVEAWVWIGEVKRCSKVISVLGYDNGHSIGWSLSAGRVAFPGEEEAKKPIILYFTSHGIGTDFLFDRSGDQPLANRWRHVAVVFDVANTARLYLDGEDCGSVAKGNPAGVGPVWLTIGCGDVDDVDFWRGRLSHVAVYLRVLSQQQIQNHCKQPGGEEAHRQSEP